VSQVTVRRSPINHVSPLKGEVIWRMYIHWTSKARYYEKRDEGDQRTRKIQLHDQGQSSLGEISESLLKGEMDNWD